MMIENNENIDELLGTTRRSLKMTLEGLVAGALNYGMEVAATNQLEEEVSTLLGILEKNNLSGEVGIYRPLTEVRFDDRQRVRIGILSLAKDENHGGKERIYEIELPQKAKQFQAYIIKRIDPEIPSDTGLVVFNTSNNKDNWNHVANNSEEDQLLVNAVITSLPSILLDDRNLNARVNIGINKHGASAIVDRGVLPWQRSRIDKSL